FLGRDFAQSRICSEQVAAMIDREIRRVLEECQEKALQILRDQTDKLHRLADALLDRETIGQEELRAIMSGEALPEKKIEMSEPDTKAVVLNEPDKASDGQPSDGQPSDGQPSDDQSSDGQPDGVL
ncbi:MAG: hypothetical protein RR482_10710, partial [Clostridia bacterium]